MPQRRGRTPVRRDLTPLGRSSALEDIDVRGARVTDPSSLFDLPGLAFVNVGETGIDPRVFEAWRAKRPAVEVLFGPPRRPRRPEVK